MRRPCDICGSKRDELTPVRELTDVNPHLAPWVAFVCGNCIRKHVGRKGPS